MQIEKGREVALEVVFARPAERDALELALKDLGFGDVLVSPLSCPLQARLVAKPEQDIALENTPDSFWREPWPLKVSALDPPRVLEHPVDLIAERAYDARLLFPSASLDALKAALITSGFKVLRGPILLRSMIRHPKLRGTLSDFIVQVNRTTSTSTGTLPLLFEDIEACDG